jgi:ADP-heptose:LPS heptosyltransferase
MISKIAIFRALHLGDLLCIIPAVRAIRHAWPDAHIALVGLSAQETFAQRFNHYFDRFIEFPGWPGLPEQEPDIEKIPAFLQSMRAEQFDLVCQMQGNGEITNTMCMLWGAATVCGLRKRGEYSPDDKLFPFSDDSEHEVLRFLKLSECLGAETKGTNLEFPVREHEESEVRAMMTSVGLKRKQYVCIHPGARNPKRRWCVANFVQVANALSHQYRIVLTGSKDETDLLRNINRQLSVPALNIVDTFGHLSVGHLGCLIRHSRLLVANDTGVSHLASALKTPSVIIFSPFSEFDRWRPLNPDLHVAIPWQRASQEHVLTAVEQALSKASFNEHPDLIPR